MQGSSKYAQCYTLIKKITAKNKDTYICFYLSKETQERYHERLKVLGYNSCQQISETYLKGKLFSAHILEF